MIETRVQIRVLTTKNFTMKSNVLSIHAISIRHIKSVEDIIAITRFFHAVIGLNFHPDTPFNDYIDRDKNPSFDTYDCKHGDALIAKMFEVAEANNRDLYEICMEADPIITKILITEKAGKLSNVYSNTTYTECIIADFAPLDIHVPVLYREHKVSYTGDTLAPEIQKALKEVGF